MATGDMKNNLRKLRVQLRQMKYPAEVEKGIIDGSVSCILPIWHFAFLEYSRPVAELISSSNLTLYGKSDLRFVETVFKILRDIFSYKPTLTKDQIMTPGFVERKIIITCDILAAVKQRHQSLNRGSKTSTKQKMSVRSKVPRSLQSTTLADSTFAPKECDNSSSLRIQQIPPVMVVKAIDSGIGKKVAAAAKPTSSQAEGGEHRPDDGYRSSNVTPEPNETEAMTANTERRLTELEAATDRKFSEIDERMTRIEDKLAEMASAGDNEIRDNSAANDYNLESILGRLTLVESRIHLLQSQNPSGIATLPAVKTESRTVTTSSKPSLVQGEPVDIITITATSAMTSPTAQNDVISSQHSQRLEDSTLCAEVSSTSPVTRKTTDTEVTSTASDDLASEAVAAVAIATSPSAPAVDSATASDEDSAIAVDVISTTSHLAEGVSSTVHQTMLSRHGVLSADDGNPSSPISLPDDYNFGRDVDKTIGKVDRLFKMLKDTQGMLGMNTSLTKEDTSTD